MDDVRTALSEGRIDQPRTRTGEVRVGDRPSLPYVVVDADGTEIEAISKYLRDLALGDASSLTCRSYAHDLLRWWRARRRRSSERVADRTRRRQPLLPALVEHVETKYARLAELLAAGRRSGPRPDSHPFFR